jgi:hypothetical protein
MKKMIAFSGSNGDDENLTESVLKMAEDVGYHIAKKGGVLICGGRGGTMRAAAKGAKKAKGLTIGILPDSGKTANEFIDIVIPTNLASFRNYILINSADAVIAVAGRWGTLNEVSFALNIGKPTVVLEGSGGWSDILSKKELLGYFKNKPYVAGSPKEAVELVFNLIEDK